MGAVKVKWQLARTGFYVIVLPVDGYNKIILINKCRKGAFYRRSMTQTNELRG